MYAAGQAHPAARVARRCGRCGRPYRTEQVDLEPGVTVSTYKCSTSSPRSSSISSPSWNRPSPPRSYCRITPTGRKPTLL